MSIITIRSNVMSESNMKLLGTALLRDSTGKYMDYRIAGKFRWCKFSHKNESSLIKFRNRT